MQNDKPTTQPPVSAGAWAPDLVKDIPIAAQAGGQKPAADDDLDKIMRDVGKDLKEVGKKPAKHHWFSKDNKSQAEPRFSARPIDQIKPPPAAPPKPDQPAPAASVKPVTKNQPQPVKTSSAPVGIIILAIIITGTLSAAAYFAYK